ncbi:MULTISPECIES: DUF4179 domain-containing protein [unclassified Viridibacillus]|uniref:DUF4179 domain-containing protein n=1 Tax=unclassified Viridibacillus TaxID=2617942 RepID=UPI00096CA9E6|nr:MULTISPECIES: DUF4179 domain-containing protein [unclassified Viridibacillus]OMC82005.1 hypothetical protein BK130_11935 [Viridibacillus sp. FSL H8-0123]OMC86163.1 hypothetical protein BK128_11655 [Viridibacillus sp. FSL H7-0596]
MTDQYKKWANLNVEDIEPMDVTDIEKARMKQRIINKKIPKIKRPVWRIAAVALMILVGSATTVSFAIPSVASQFPFIKGIVNYFTSDNDKFYEQYSDYATDIEQLEISNGITMMIENAVYDGNTITITYALETEHDLGVNPRVGQFIDVEGSVAIGGGDSLQQISPTKYVGLARVTPTFKKDLEKVQVQWSPKSFTNDTTDETVNGDWKFNFELEKVQDEIQLVNQSITDAGMTLIINEIRKTDVSTIIKMKQITESRLLKKWHLASPALAIRDDVGNVYHVVDNGGSSMDNGVTTEWSQSIGVIDKRATKLYIEPTMILSLGEAKGSEKYKMKTIEVSID